MTNAGMNAINEALTVVEKAPTVFSDDSKAVPISTVLILELVIKLATHARDNKTLITKTILDDPMFKGLDLTEDMTISVYLKHTINRANELFSMIDKMSPGYPLERLLKMVTEQMDSHKANIAKYGVACV